MGVSINEDTMGVSINEDTQKMDGLQWNIQTISWCMMEKEPIPMDDSSLKWMVHNGKKPSVNG